MSRFKSYDDQFSFDYEKAAEEAPRRPYDQPPTVIAQPIAKTDDVVLEIDDEERLDDSQS